MDTYIRLYPPLYGPSLEIEITIWVKPTRASQSCQYGTLNIKLHSKFAEMGRKWHELQTGCKLAYKLVIACHVPYVKISLSFVLSSCKPIRLLTGHYYSSYLSSYKPSHYNRTMWIRNGVNVHAKTGRRQRLFTI